MNERSVCCEEVQSQLDAWSTGELPLLRAEEVRMHVSTCQQCSKVLAEMRIVVGQIAKAKGNLPPEVTSQMLPFIHDLAKQRREKAKSPSLVDSKGKNLLPVALTCALTGLYLFRPWDLPLAVSLSVIGLMFNLGGLILVLPAVRRSGRWSRL